MSSLVGSGVGLTVVLYRPVPVKLVILAATQSCVQAAFPYGSAVSVA